MQTNWGSDIYKHTLAIKLEYLYLKELGVCNKAPQLILRCIAEWDGAAALRRSHPFSQLQNAVPALQLTSHQLYQYNCCGAVL